jgi:hypothetical protein
MLRRIFEPKRDEVTGKWRRLHNKELYTLYCSPNIIRVLKLRKLCWAGRVAYMGRGEAHTGFRWGNLMDGDHLQGPGVDGRIILKLVFEKCDGRHGLHRCGSG